MRLSLILLLFLSYSCISQIPDDLNKNSIIWYTDTYEEYRLMVEEAIEEAKEKEILSDHYTFLDLTAYKTKKKYEKDLYRKKSRIIKHKCIKFISVYGSDIFSKEYEKIQYVLKTKTYFFITHNGSLTQSEIYILYNKDTGEIYHEIDIISDLYARYDYDYFNYICDINTNGSISKW